MIKAFFLFTLLTVAGASGEPNTTGDLCEINLKNGFICSPNCTLDLTDCANKKMVLHVPIFDIRGNIEHRSYQLDTGSQQSSIIIDKKDLSAPSLYVFNLGNKRKIDRSN